MNFYREVLFPFFEHTYSSPNRIAFVFENKQYTYQEFAKRVLGIQREVEKIPALAVGLYTDTSVDTYAAIWAIWLSGKHYVPVMTDAPPLRNAAVLNEAGVSDCLLANTMATWASYEGDLEEGFAPFLDRVEQYDAELAYILFTSGSTGKPKGVMVTKGNVGAFMRSYNTLGYNIVKEDKILQPFELTFDLSIVSFLQAFVFGACLYPTVKGAHKVASVAALIEEAEISVCVLSPSLVQFFKPYFDELLFPFLRLVIFCGEALSESLLNGWAACCMNAQLDNVYGPTEHTIFCTRYTYRRGEENEVRHGIVSLGLPMDGTSVLIVDEDGQVVVDGEAGELLLAGEQLMLGYLHRPDLNKEVFVDYNEGGELKRFYRTGDLCVKQADGRIDYIARLDHQVKIQGYRVELGEIEYHVREALKLDVAIVVLNVKNERGHDELVLFIQSEEMDVMWLLEKLRLQLPGYMVPSQVVFMWSFPMNTSSKTDRKAMVEYWNTLQGRGDAV